MAENMQEVDKPSCISPTHSHTHTLLWWYGEGAKCVGEMEGRIDRAAKECCKPWKKTKASCFPTVHQTLLAWELQRYHQHSHTYRNTCIQSPGSSRVIKKKNSMYPGNINKRLWEPTHLAEGGIVLFCTPSHSRLWGIHLESLFMSYGALQNLT